jgi:ribose transport system substrate-binding protein
MKKSISTLLAVLLIAATLLSACSSAAPVTQEAAAQPTVAPEVPAEAPKQRVGYLIPDASNSFLSTLTESVKAKFAQDGVEVLIASADGDAKKQYDQIENFISMGVDTMIIMSVDPVGVLSAVDEAKAAGIKTLGVPVDTQGPYDAYMHTDQTEIGKLMAQMGCDFIKKTYPDAAEQSIEVGILSTEGAPEMKKRTDGMRTIDEICPQAKTVAYVDVPNATITNGMTSAENLLTAHPNIKVFLVVGDSGAQGASQAIQAFAPNDLAKYGVFSGDVNPENIPVIEGCNDPYRGAVAIGGGPEELAQRTYELVKLMLAGDEFPAETLDPLVTITCK